MSVTCDKCKHAEESNTAVGDYFCTRYKIICSGILGCDLGYPKMKTNADRIRAMTDEELADFLQDIANLGGVNGLQKIMTWIEWLKEEAKDAY